MATITSTALLNKKVDKTILNSLSLGAKHPGIRKIFKAMSRAFVVGRLTKFSDISKVKGFQGAADRLTKTESAWYQRVLVPIGFPVIKQKTFRSVGIQAIQMAPDVARKVVNIKRLEKNLQQHISFLQEETFFQKAHKRAKQVGIIGRSEAAREWYQDYALEQGLNFRSMDMLRTGGRRITDIRLGRMYFFRYRPKEPRDMYDEFPLIFLLYEDPDNFSGINFHYLSPKLRAVLLGNMLMYLNNQDYSDRTKLFARKFRSMIQTNRRF